MSQGKDSASRYHRTMSSSSPDTGAPRLLGFDVPDLQENVDQTEDEAIIAMLDVAPHPSWLALFDARIDALKNDLGVAGVEVDGPSIRFYGSISDGRRLATAVASLINDVTLDYRAQSSANRGPSGPANPV